MASNKPTGEMHEGVRLKKEARAKNQEQRPWPSAIKRAVNLWMWKAVVETLKVYVKKNRVELEMFLNGKFIDSMTITEKDLERIHDLMEKKHCRQLEYSDGQPQFFVSGLSEEDVEVWRDAEMKGPGVTPGPVTFSKISEG